MESFIEAGQVYPSFADFSSELRKYESQTGFFFSTISSKTVVAKNKTIKDESKWYPDEWKYTSLVLGCKQYGTYCSRSKGQRVNLSTYKSGCQAILKLSANKERGGLVITQAHMDHNHQKGDHKYPEERRLIEPQVQELQSLLELEVPVKKIAEHFQEKFDVGVTDRCIRNYKLKAKRTQPTEEQELWNELNQLAGEGGGVTIVRDETEKLHVLFVQTSTMKETWSKYPQTLYLDSTYKVNARNMPLFVFMTSDGNNKGRVVAYALVIDEKSATISACLDAFIANNDCSSLDSVMIDKDFAELKSVKQKMPNTAIILCKFHVLQVFEERVKKQPNKDDVLHCLRDMVDSRSLDKYNLLLRRLTACATHEFIEYFVNNWDNMRVHWAGYHVRQYTHFGNRTNNFVERHNRTIKDAIDHTKSVPDLVRHLIKLEKRKHDQVAQKTSVMKVKRKQVFIKCNEHMDSFAFIHEKFTKYAAKILQNELEVCVGHQLFQSVSQLDTGEYQVSYKDNTYKVVNDACECSVFVCERLLCRHIFSVRLTLKQQLICEEDIPRKYRLSHFLGLNESESEGRVGSVNVVDCVRSREKVLSPNEKFRKLRTVALELCDISSCLGTSAFWVRYDFLCELLDMWKQDKILFLLDAESGTSFRGREVVTEVVDEAVLRGGEQDMMRGEEEQDVLRGGEEEHNVLGGREEEQGVLGGGEEAQDVLGGGQEEQDVLGGGQEEQGVLVDGQEEQGVLGGGQEEQDVLGGGQEEQGVLGDGQEEQGVLGGGEEEQDVLGGGEEEQDVLGGGQEEQDVLGGGQEEQGVLGGEEEEQGVLGGGEEQDVLRSGEGETVPFVLPSRLKRKGRPTGGSKRKFKSTKIERESGQFFIVDARFVLSKLITEQLVVDKVLNKEILITKDMIDEAEMINLVVADCKLDLFKEFFDDECWDYFHQLVLRKRKYLWLCPVCMDTQRNAMQIACDHCHQWFHFSCVDLNEDVSVNDMQWLCSRCEIVP